MSQSFMDNLKNELKKAVSQHYRTLMERYPEEDFYGYSLYTSDDVSSIGPVSNRVSSLKTVISDPMYVYYRYSPDEWSDWDDLGLFDQVNRMIKAYCEEMDDDFGKFREDVLRQALQTLIELEVEGLFGVKDDQRFLILWLSGSADPIMDAAARALNTQKAYEKFASEFS